MRDNVIILNRTPDDWRAIFRKFFRSGGVIAVIVLLLTLLILGNPLYFVGVNEQGVVLRFGKHVRTSLPGPGFKLPWPVESVTTVDVQKVKEIKIGYAVSGEESGFGMFGGASVPSEETGKGELMLTGDENIIAVKLSVQFRVIDPVAYLFNVSDPVGTLEDVCEASLRRAVGDYGVDMALTEGKAAIEDEIRRDTQSLSDRYGLGVELTTVNLRDAQPPDQVQQAFKSVISAKEKKQQIINQAQTYQNGQIPKAEGEAASIVNAASAYARERVLRSQGEVQRFSALLQEYRLAKQVTKDRLYLEALEEILSNVDVTVVDKNLGNILPLLDVTGPVSKPDGGTGQTRPSERVRAMESGRGQP